MDILKSLKNLLPTSTIDPKILIKMLHMNFEMSLGKEMSSFQLVYIKSNNELFFIADNYKHDIVDGGQIITLAKSYIPDELNKSDITIDRIILDVDNSRTPPYEIKVQYTENFTSKTLTHTI